MRVIKKPEDRKNEILDVAEFLFITQGYTKTTVNDILMEIGIAKGTLYHYFRSKEELMDAIVLRYIDHGVRKARAIAANSELNASEKIAQILMSQKPDTERKEDVIKELHQVDNEEMHQKSLVETVLQLTPVLTGVIEQGNEEGSFNTPYPKETVEFLLVSSSFLFDDGIFNWQPQELEQKAIAFSYVVETILGAEKGSFDSIAEMIVSSNPVKK